MARVTKAERDESIAKLRAYLKPGDVVTAVFRSHAPSGATQWDFYKMTACDKYGRLSRLWLSFHIARALGFRLSKADSVCLPFMNMDPAFAVVYSLAGTLFRNERQATIDRHDSRGSGGRGMAGYCLSLDRLG